MRAINVVLVSTKSDDDQVSLIIFAHKQRQDVPSPIEELEMGYWFFT